MMAYTTILRRFTTYSNFKLKQMQRIQIIWWFLSRNFMSNFDFTLVYRLLLFPKFYLPFSPPILTFLQMICIFHSSTCFFHPGIRKIVYEYSKEAQCLICLCHSICVAKIQIRPSLLVKRRNSVYSNRYFSTHLCSGFHLN